MLLILSIKDINVSSNYTIQLIMNKRNKNDKRFSGFRSYTDINNYNKIKYLIDLLLVSKTNDCLYSF